MSKVTELFINSISSTFGAVELDIDGGVGGIVIGATGDGGVIGVSVSPFGLGTPGIIINPGGSADINPSNSSPGQTSNELRKRFCEQNPDAAICNSGSYCP